MNARLLIIDDEATIRLFRLFNEPAGQEALLERGVPADAVELLPLLGISGICNLLAAIKTLGRVRAINR